VVAGRGVPGGPEGEVGVSSWCRQCQLEATRRWRAEHPEQVARDNAKRWAAYAAARPERHCSECGALLEGRRFRVCSRRCKDARYRRLHPDAVKAKQARKYQRRKAREQ
jgi:hypothetical protein